MRLWKVNTGKIKDRKCWAEFGADRDSDVTDVVGVVLSCMFAFKRSVTRIYGDSSIGDQLFRFANAPLYLVVSVFLLVCLSVTQTFDDPPIDLLALEVVTPYAE